MEIISKSKRSFFKRIQSRQDPGKLIKREKKKNKKEEITAEE